MRPQRYNHGYPSSTGLPGLIDKPGLRYWYGAKGTSECEKVKKKSQQIGKEVHDAIEKYLRGKKDYLAKLDATQTRMFTQVKDWCIKTKFHPISMEEPLYWYCKKHHPKPHVNDCKQDCPEDCTSFSLAGTPDAIGTFNGWKTLSVVDWKTDAVPTDRAGELEKAVGYYWQNASYAMMYNRTHGTDINQAFTVRATSPEKVKDRTTKKENLVLPPFVTVEYSDDYTFAVYTFKDLKMGMTDVRMLRRLYRRTKGK